MWKIIGDNIAFSLDNSNYYLNNACYILTGNKLEYLLAFMNSKIIKWYSFLTNMNKTGVGDMQIGAQNVNLFPIPIISNPLTENMIINCINNILDNNEKKYNEEKLQKIIYNIYDLNKSEIEFIEIQ